MTDEEKAFFNAKSLKLEIDYTRKKLALTNKLNELNSQYSKDLKDFISEIEEYKKQKNRNIN